MNKISKSRLAILVMVIATMMITSTMVINAYAAPTTRILGVGKGDYFCSDGRNNARDIPFSIEATKGQGKVSGSYAIKGLGGEISGDIYGGKIGKTSYSLLSIKRTDINICPGDALPLKGTITGTCDQDQDQLEFRFENGQHGTFTGNVICFG